MESKNKSIQIMQKFKNDTKEYHSKIESLPYFKALMEHKLPLACYVNQLRALAIIHGVLEHELSTSADERITSVWDDGLKKLPFLEKDLVFFAPRVISDTHASINIALSMTEKIRLRKIENPLTLLGYLYVFEGSTLGNCMHRPDISKTFNLDGMNGCVYYSSYKDQVQKHWNHFSKKMNIALNDPSLHKSAIQAAHEAFAGLESLYTALFSVSKNETLFHATRINPEAGNHPVPSDEKEIKAALKASELGWAEFPYYQERYGERGKRFSDSDTCWLVTLTNLNQESLQSQINWLCRVLATRGMPSIMMEQILTFLFEELTRALPDKKDIYLKLKTSADDLKRQRLNALPEKEFDSLATKFDKTAGLELADCYKNTGKLIVAAVVDEKSGIEGTVDALKKWLTDKERFSDEWINAVNETIKKANSFIAG